MMVDRMSRPWLSVPRKKAARPLSVQAGGRKALLRSSAAMLNGSCGDSQGAAAAAVTQTSVSAAASMVTGDLRKLQARSWSQSRRSSSIAVLLDGGEARLRAVVRAVRNADALLHH